MLRQVTHWILTIPHYGFLPYLPNDCVYIRGQLEQGEGGFLHWQLYVVFKRKVRLGGVKSVFGEQCHAEATRSDAARNYVWKEDTRIAGTQFELGSLPVRRNSVTDWDAVWSSAITGAILDVPSNVRVQHYRTLRCIAADFGTPVGIVKETFVFYGPTGTGKSRRAWDEAGMDAFPKDPRSKFWDGYQGQRFVVIDEFRGGIDIAHLLRWLDRYPVNVEIKGSSVPLKAEKIWITSNLNPRQWYPDLDEETMNALLRRLNITHFVDL